MSSPRLLIGRQSVPGSAYAVTAVVAGRRAVLVEAMAEAVVDELRHAERQRLVASIAWAVMPDHLHWLFELRSPSLGAVVRQVKSRAAQRVNAIAGGQAALWQAGYYDHQVRRHEDLAMQARYILANPVRRGLCREIGGYPYAWCRYPL